METNKFKGGQIYSLPMSDIEYIGYFYGKKGSETVQSAFSRLKAERGRAPDFLMNAELFDFDTRAAASDVVCDGVIHRLTEGYGLAFPDNKTAVFSYKNNVNAKDYVGAYPVLLRNGDVETSIPSGIGGARGRTAIGVGNGELHIALVPDGSGGVTLSELRFALQGAGATDAINLDGGGSTQFYAPLEHHLSGRPVRGFIGIWLKNSPEKKRRVFLSAGHGGSDSGAVAFGLKEKDINLRVILSCKAELERHGVTVVCSRVIDENDRVADEVKEANASGAELAVSFHANAGGGDGFEAFYWTTNKKDKRLAELCEKHIKALGQNSRGLKSGNHLYWCKNTTMTSCLVESFFLDNDKDNDIGDTSAEQDVFGVAYAKAILEYLGIEYKAKPYYDAVKSRFGFTDETMKYLSNYKYADSLLEKLATKG